MLLLKSKTAGCLNPKNRFWKLKVTGFSFGKGRGFCISNRLKVEVLNQMASFYQIKKIILRKQWNQIMVVEHNISSRIG